MHKRLSFIFIIQIQIQQKNKNKIDAPEVTLVGTPTVDLEENIDSVSLRCRADANPPATVIWRRVGGNPSMTNRAPVVSMGDIYSFQETLEFSPVTRKDSATYSCEAKNTIGTSNLITIPIDIKCKSAPN